ncbi:hypothetical protein BT96DRAFT_944524 [Gymnopus androsaceus JB14]|uniref:Uncharacterized protein n=1 Tax=Gymnopus androsaceus JB14 TaxID=1447944 RepID=A0A6A4H5X5_9AGAR|nr:hypothetical protein BT96DRAFT_944524 [Gymnopus androsaceus JB14]
MASGTYNMLVYTAEQDTGERTQSQDNLTRCYGLLTLWHKAVSENDDQDSELVFNATTLTSPEQSVQTAVHFQRKDVKLRLSRFNYHDAVLEPTPFNVDQVLPLLQKFQGPSALEPYLEDACSLIYSTLEAKIHAEAVLMHWIAGVKDKKSTKDWPIGVSKKSCQLYWLLCTHGTFFSWLPPPELPADILLELQNLLLVAYKALLVLPQAMWICPLTNMNLVLANSCQNQLSSRRVNASRIGAKFVSCGRGKSLSNGAAWAAQSTSYTDASRTTGTPATTQCPIAMTDIQQRNLRLSTRNSIAIVNARQENTSVAELRDVLNGNVPKGRKGKWLDGATVNARVAWSLVHIDPIKENGRKLLNPWLQSKGGHKHLRDLFDVISSLNSGDKLKRFMLKQH